MSEEVSVVDWLDKLAEIRSAVNALSQERQTAIDAAMPPEVKAAMDAIDAEYAGKIGAASQNASELEKNIKDAILATGKSVRGHALHAVWARGRVSWETSKLEGLMIAVPQLKELRKEGEPSVSIREAK